MAQSTWRRYDNPDTMWSFTRRDSTTADRLRKVAVTHVLPEAKIDNTMAENVTGRSAEQMCSLIMLFR